MKKKVKIVYCPLCLSNRISNYNGGYAYTCLDCEKELDFVLTQAEGERQIKSAKLKAMLIERIERRNRPENL